MSAVLFACTVWATTLEISFVDPEGNPVTVSNAELLLFAWGATERIELETSAQGLSLDLDPDWLRSRWPGFDHQMGVYLYLQAPPFVAIRSHPFIWPGVDQDAAAVTIAFPRSQQAVVAIGTEASMTLAFRTGTVRRVRIVDPQGAPRPGIAIDAFMFWSQSNRCAVLAGGEPLGSYVTDAGGWIEVPDGDFEYALELGRMRQHDHVFVANGRYERERLVTELTQPETDVVVYEFPIRPLELRVQRGEEPASGVVLHGYLANCPCGACSGPMATTDEAGIIRMEGFRPEEFAWLWLVDGSRELWRTEPASWPSNTVDIRLSRDADTVEASFSP